MNFEYYRPWELNTKYIEDLKTEYKQKRTYYTDEIFPANLSSLVNTINSNGYLYKCYNFWEKISLLYPLNKLNIFDDFLDPNDIISKEIANDSLISALKIICRYPDVLHNIFENQIINKEGIYYIKLNIDGIWRFILIDEFIPCDVDKNPGFLTINKIKKNFSIWPLLIEKALAKIYGSYELIGTVQVSEILKTLTGASFKYINIDDNNLENILNDSKSKGFLIFTESLYNDSSNKDDIKENKIYLLNKISGKKIELNELISNEKISIELNNPHLNIDNFLIFEINNEIKQINTIIRMKTNAFSVRSFFLKEKSNFNLTVTQRDSTYFPRINDENTFNSKNSYVSTRILLFRSQDSTNILNENCIFLTGIYDCQKNVSLRLENMRPGYYFVLINLDWDKNTFDSVLSFNGKEEINFERLRFQDYESIINKLIIKIGGIILLNDNNDNYQIQKIFNIKFGILSDIIKNKNLKKLELKTKNYYFNENFVVIGTEKKINEIYFEKGQEKILITKIKNVENIDIEELKRNSLTQN